MAGSYPIARRRHAPAPLALLIPIALTVLWMRAALAEDSAYCRKVRARADQAAAVLLWPRVQMEGLRFPTGSGADLGPTTGANYQARMSLSFSPVDALRGVRLRSAADADCELQEVATPLQEILRDLTEELSLPALRAQAKYLIDQRAGWRELLDRADARREAGLITILEYQELRRLVGLLDRKLETTSGQVRSLEARTFVTPSGSLHQMAAQYVKRGVLLERRLSALDALGAWGFTVSGGVIPAPGQPLDWYAMAQISYGLGGLTSSRHEAERLRARADELRHARYELPARLAELRAVFQAELDQARREIEVVQDQMTSIAGTLAALEGADAPGAAPEQAQAVLEVEQIALASDAVFLRALVDGLATLIDEDGSHVASSGR